MSNRFNIQPAARRLRALLMVFARGFGITALTLIILFGSSAKANAQSKEYALKAAFLFHFTQFVDWPAEAFAHTNSPFVIGVLGTDPFGRLLPEVVENEKVKGRSIVIRYFKSPADITESHVLYLSNSEEANFERYLRIVKGRPVLTVSDIDQFASKGGMIRFITENNKIRFKINNEAAQKAGLTISSKLLRLAELVPTQQ